MRIAFWRKAVPVEPDEVNPERDARYRELAEQIVEELRAEREDAVTAALVADNAAEQVAEGCGCGPTSVCPQGVEADLVARGLKIAIDADCPGCGWAERNYDPATGLFGCPKCDVTTTTRGDEDVWEPEDDDDDEPGPMARAQELWAQYKHQMTLENTPAAFMNDEYTYADDVWMSEEGRSEELEKELLAVVRAHPDVFAGTWFGDMLQEADEARTTVVEADDDGCPTGQVTCSMDPDGCDHTADAAVEALDALGFDVEDARAQARAREAGVTTTFVAIDDMPTWTGMRTTVVEHREHPNGEGVRIEHPERQHEAPVPSPQLCALWRQAVGDDTHAALLCATAAEAQARALQMYVQARKGSGTVAAAVGALSAAWECAADVAQYFGETLPDQHGDVQRAAGFRV